MPGGAGTGFRSAKPDEHRPARSVANVAHRPVAALAPPVAEVMAAYRLRLSGEAARQLGSVAGHHATSRGTLALCCIEAVNRPRDGTQSKMRNIYVGATYSVLCSTAHKTDAANDDHGDLLDIIRARCGLRDFGDVVREARQFLNLPRSEPTPADAPTSLWTPRASAHSARRLFAASRPISGTLAETYLRNRRISPLIELGDLTSLRFHPRCFYRADADSPNESLPAMIAAVTDLDGAITGVQRTWLDPSGRGKAAIETPRRAMGNLLGNAVRFGVALDSLAAGEGIETVLSLRSVMPTLPMAAALSSAHLAALLFPKSLRRLYVVRDNDSAGNRATARLVDRANAAGIEAIVLSPRLKDFNDDLRALGVDAMRSWLQTQLAREDVARFPISET